MVESHNARVRRRSMPVHAARVKISRPIRRTPVLARDRRLLDGSVPPLPASHTALAPAVDDHGDRERILQVIRATMSADGSPYAMEPVALAALGIGGSQRCTVFSWRADLDELRVDADCVAGLWSVPLASGSPVKLDRWQAAKAVLSDQKPSCSVGAASGRSDGALSSTMLLPLVVSGECLGLMLFAKPGEVEFTAEACRSGQAAAAAVAAAMHNGRLLARTRRQAEEQAALFQISQAAVSIHDQATVLREIARTLLQVMDCESCTVEVWHRDTDEMEIVAREHVPSWPATDRQTGRFSLRDHRGTRFVLEQQAPLELNLQQTGLTETEREFLQRSGTEGILLVPMVIAGDTIGLISLASRHRRAFGVSTYNFVQEIAAQTALALQNARFVERARKQAEEQTALLKVSQAVISAKSLNEVLSEIARAALGLGAVDGCRILLWHASTEQVELAAEENVPDWQTYYQIGERYPVADWPSVRQAMGNGIARAFQVADADITTRERANHAADGIKSGYLIPIMGGTDCLGCLCLHARDIRRFDTDAVRIGRELAAQAAHAVDRALLFGKLQARAETDGLTSLLNHRAAFETLDREISFARKNAASVGVIVLDLDDFKLFNDTHGHLIGDKVLIAVSRVLRETVRPRDYVARFGGDEFLLILPNANEVAASVIAERLVQRMEQTTVDIGDLRLPIRFSVGVATFPKDAKSRQELIAFADSSMYAAKELGGGQVGSVERGTRSLEVSTLGALSGLVRAVDRKDRYTKDHSDLVAEYAIRFAKSLRMTPEKIEALELAGQLHDVGKIAVPDSILRKPGYLTREEEAMIRQHVVFSELMIKGVPHLDDVLAAVAHHHERWDGGGYPNGKSGTQIPLLGRILALADALAAMTHDRPYRKGRSLPQAVEEIRAGAGTQFDPDLVEPFIDAVTTGTALLRDSLRRHELPIVSTSGLLRVPLRPPSGVLPERIHQVAHSGD